MSSMQPAGIKEIKMATGIFATQESPISMRSGQGSDNGGRRGGATGQVPVVAFPADLSPIVTAKKSITANAVVIANENNSDDDDDDDDEDTVPLADLIKQSMAPLPASPATSPLQATTSFNNWNHNIHEKSNNETRKLNTTTDSTKKYRVMMADCSDLLSEIENMLV